MSKGSTILLVDDDPFELEVHIAELETLGYTVRQEGNAEGGLAAAREQEFSLLVVDLMMPTGAVEWADHTDEGRKTGVVLLEKLKVLQPSAPVLILTARRDHRTVLSESNYDGVLQKPCLPSDLKEAVSNLL